MPKTAKSKPAKPPPGGRRPGAGRPPNAKNKATILRELQANKAIDKVLAKLQPGQADRLTPIEVMSLAMSALLTSGDLMGAVAVADKLAPYLHSKMSANLPDQLLPDDLLPDEPPNADEPGPEHPIY
jgi:hypothetical protein